MSSIVGDFFVGFLMLSQYIMHLAIKYPLVGIIYCVTVPITLFCDAGYYVKNGKDREPTLQKQLEYWVDSVWSFGVINPWSNNDK